ncbi:hypothetical protein [Ralstonia sp. A12]|uniref:hypothetical protein n=1 Tax=Ralstonia sp. A12 TaxID=1217052 RepID=UPI0012EEA38A|nr:hypothetical protein [Ralstonia sp. A12]
MSPILRLPSRAGGTMVLLLAATVAHAEPEHSAQMPVPELAYSSAFAAYKGYADQPVTSWREANDTVGHIGGWRSYAKEATQAAVPPAPSATSSAPAPVGRDDVRSVHEEAGREQ